jgi:hypothetical protein
MTRAIDDIKKKQGIILSYLEALFFQAYPATPVDNWRTDNHHTSFEYRI